MTDIHAEATRGNARDWIETRLMDSGRDPYDWDLDSAARMLYDAAVESHAPYYDYVPCATVERILETTETTYANCDAVRFTKRQGRAWPDGTKWGKTIPASGLAWACVTRWHDLDGGIDGGAGEYLPDETLRSEYETLAARQETEDDDLQPEWKALWDRIRTHAADMDTERLARWYCELNDPATITGMKPIKTN